MGLSFKSERDTYETNIILSVNYSSIKEVKKRFSETNWRNFASSMATLQEMLEVLWGHG